MEEALGYPVSAFRFENDVVVGEYSPSSGVDVETYLAEFNDLYGTQPEISHVVVEMPTEQAKSLYMSKGLTVSPPLSSTARSSSYVAPAADPARIEQLFESRRERAGIDMAGVDQQARGAARAATRWEPTSVDVQITRPTSSTVLFDQYLNWYPGQASTDVMNGEDGWEAEVNVYTDASAYQVNQRPNCSVAAANYKDRPFAKNYGWNWSVMYDSGFGLNPLPSRLGAYADYNDLFDECNRNSIGIGIRSPQTLGAWPNGMQEMLILVTAPRGLDNIGRISGNIQPVNSTGCLLQPWLSNTDCMGLTQTGYQSRGTLASWRNWTAPTVCWNSGGYGEIPPSKYPC